MTFFKMNPVTQKRIMRFRRIKSGWYAFLILTASVLISLGCEYLANHRAVVVCYEGNFIFPTWTYHSMAEFGQTDEWGFDDVEADYAALQAQLGKPGVEGWVLMPVIPFDPYRPDFSYEEPPPNAPDGRHWLGTDSQGRDVAARLLYGFRISMVFALTLTLVGYMVGVVVGSLQGFMGGWLDIGAQRFIEIWAAPPFLVVMIVLSSVVPQRGFVFLLVIMALWSWIGITFYMRTEMYREKTREYCLAARSYGASKWRLMFKHLLPNCITPLVTFAPFAVVGGVLSLTSLDFLGFGLPPPAPSWGELIEQGRQNMDKPWLVYSPFVALVLTLALVNLIGQSVREAFDPKQFSRYR